MQKPARSKGVSDTYERSGLLHYDYVTKYMPTCLSTKNHEDDTKFFLPDFDDFDGLIYFMLQNFRFISFVKTS